MLLKNLTLATCLLFLAACGEVNQPPKADKPRKHVSLFAVRMDETQNLERVPGNVHPATAATLEAKISGRILKLHVKEGDVVQNGQLLIELDAHEIQAKLDQATASARQAQQDLKRFTQLLPSGAITKQQFDDADARASVAEASLAEAKAMVGYARIEAPFDGIITKKIADQGDLALPGKPLLTIEKQGLYRFEADIPETIAAGVRQGSVLNIRLSGIDAEIEGTTSEISPTTDPNSRTLHVKFDLPANDLLRSGQFGSLMVPIQKRSVIKVPSGSVLERGQIEVVFVVKDAHALLRLVRTGSRNASSVEILSGLQQDEQIVVDPSSLEDGDPVEVAK